MSDECFTEPQLTELLFISLSLARYTAVCSRFVRLHCSATFQLSRCIISIRAQLAGAGAGADARGTMVQTLAMGCVVVSLLLIGRRDARTRARTHMRTRYDDVTHLAVMSSNSSTLHRGVFAM